MNGNSKNDLKSLNDEDYHFPRLASYPTKVENDSSNGFFTLVRKKHEEDSVKKSNFVSRMFTRKNKDIQKEKAASSPSFPVKKNSFFREEILVSGVDGSPQKSSRSTSALLKILYKIHSVALFGNGVVDRGIDSVQKQRRPIDVISVGSESSLISSENVHSRKEKLKIKSSQVTSLDQPKHMKPTILFKKSDFRNKPRESTEASGNFPSFHYNNGDTLNTSAFEAVSEIPLVLSTNLWEYGELECWMTNLPHKLQMVPIHHLLLPGSHDSFSYSLDGGILGPDSPSILHLLATCIPCIVWPAILRWVVTQRTSVTEQLLHGIRYFDIRVAGLEGRFYFVHGLYGADLEPILEEIRIFLSSHPGEVVILDFQHFYSFNEELHESLVTLLSSIFAGIICPNYESLDHLNLAFLTKHNLQVLIFYRNFSTVVNHGLWPGGQLPNPWPRTTQPSELIMFLKKHLAEKSQNFFFVTQCVLTPTSRYLAFNFLGSLEKNLARPCNKETLTWISSLGKGDRSPNIIMADFVDHDDWAISRAIIRQNISDI